MICVVAVLVSHCSAHLHELHWSKVGRGADGVDAMA
jgi:hypothetical protein